MTEKQDYLLLSADGDISLYKVDKRILQNFDELLDLFFKWKNTKCYDESLFVTYLKKHLGEESISYCKTVGCVGGRINESTGCIEDEIDEEYKDIKWFNFQRLLIELFAIYLDNNINKDIYLEEISWEDYLEQTVQEELQ